MCTEELKKQVADEFGDAVAADEQLLNQCISISKNYNILPSDMRYKWEALNYNTYSSLSPLLTIDRIDELRARVKSDIEAGAKRTQHVRPNSAFASLSARRGGKFGSLAGALNGPPKVGKIPVKAEYVKMEVDEKVAGPSRVNFVGPRKDMESMNQRGYRYMFEKPSERSAVLDDRIEEIADAVRTHYKIDEFSDPAASTEEQVTVVGRIVLDAESTSASAKLNETSLLIESSRMMGSGARMPLRISPDVKIRGAPAGVGGVGLFPGAIVALRGRNGGGGWFVAEEILAPPPLKASQPQASTSPFRMCIACGPFTPDTSLDFKSWQSLIQTLQSTKPDVVLLTGPFIDATHPSIINGEVDASPAQIFQDVFVKALSDFLRSSEGSMVLLVPNVRDIVSDHAVFPQREFAPGTINHSRIQLLPNPCRFSVNGISFGTSSVDVLFHLRKEELFKRGTEIEPSPSIPGTANDGMTMLSRHLLQQRSFYPLFPAPLDLSHEVNLDITHSDGIKLISTEDEPAPDVLILPSKLRHFSKPVDNSLAVNPGHLSKGTYALLSYTGPGSTPIRERLSAEITKLS